MNQFVIRTSSKVKSQQYLAKSLFVGFFYTEKAHIFDSAKEVDEALSWAKKYLAKEIKSLKENIEHYKNEVSKGNLSINKVMLDKSKQELKEYQAFNFKVIKL